MRSQAALVLDQQSGEVLFGKNTQSTLPIASLAKLMTAIVILDDDGNELPPGEVGHIGDRHARGAHCRRGATAAEYAPTGGVEALRQFDDAGLVEHGQQRGGHTQNVGGGGPQRRT